MARKAAPRRPSGRRSERLETKRKAAEEKKVVTAVAAALAAKNDKTKANRARRPRQRKDCHLLNLPGELRNRIYELAVVKPDGLFIDAEGPGEPSLLWTCRKIRREAGSLYYGANQFYLCVESYNGTAFLPFHRQARKFWLWAGKQDVIFMFDDERDWDNVVAWVKASHIEGALVPEWEEPCTKDQFVVAGAFKLAEDCGVWSWRQKEDMLKVLYRTLRGTNSAWVKAEDRVYI